jgi:hypothetical protein
VSLGVYQAPFLPPKGRPIRMWVLTSLMSRATKLVPEPFWFLFVTETCFFVSPGERFPPLGPKHLVVSGKCDLLGRPGMLRWWKEGENTTANPRWVPRNVVGRPREMGHQSFQELSLLSSQTVTKWIHIQSLSPKNKGAYLI